jgi:hypothetical protein
VAFGHVGSAGSIARGAAYRWSGEAVHADVAGRHRLGAARRLHSMLLIQQGRVFGATPTGPLRALDLADSVSVLTCLNDATHIDELSGLGPSSFTTFKTGAVG